MQNGITLIALVVTIVVLLILAGVSINLVIGDNGIIKKAGDAKNQTEQATANDQASMSGLYDEIQDYLGEFPSTDYTTPYLPTGFRKVSGTNLDTGLVIQDGAGNQYVWVEVPKTATVYQTAGLAITNFTEAEYTAIENDLHTYTDSYRDETTHTDTYYADSTEGWFTEAEYYTAKNNMLKSVYENGGFYVGKYETGIAYGDANGARTAKGDTTQTPVIQANAYPYNYVTRTQAKVLADTMESGNRTSSLMFGVQWDLVLKYLQTKGANLDELNSDSKDWGNYANEPFNVTSTIAQYAIRDQSTGALGSWNATPTSYTKPGSGTEKCVLLTTGANETRNSKMNICDLAGNVCEWTLENYSSDIGHCAYRGGGYYLDSNIYPASVCKYSMNTNGRELIGFRVSIY